MFVMYVTYQYPEWWIDLASGGCTCFNKQYLQFAYGEMLKPSDCVWFIPGTMSLD